MNWRSPPMLPPPVDPARVTRPVDPAARFALGAAWRLRALAHGLAHGLRRVGAEHHARVAQRITRLLAASDAFLAAGPLERCGEDGDLLVRARLTEEPLPYPESLAEVALADVLYGGAFDRALAGLVESSDASIARAASTDRGASFGAEVLAELAADERNRPCLQMLVDRWAADCCRVFGKPESAADAALVRETVKTEPAADALLHWLDATETMLEAWGLCLPDAQFMGIEVARDWTPRRRPSRRPH